MCEAVRGRPARLVAGLASVLLASCAVHPPRPALTSAFWNGVRCMRVAYTQSEELPQGRMFYLRVSAPDGADATTVASSREPLMSPAWSPDGSRIAYMGFESGHSVLYDQVLASGAIRPLSHRAGLNGSPAYSPDGKELALTVTNGLAVNIYVLTLATGALRQLTDGSTVDTEAAWAPDGRSLAFTSDREGPPEVFRVSAAGGPAERVSPPHQLSVHPSFAPDGRSIFLVNLASHSYRVRRLDLGSGALVSATDGPYDEAPAVSPNGTHLLWVGGTMAERTLQQLRLDVDPSPLWTGPAHVEEAAWSPCVFPAQADVLKP